MKKFLSEFKGLKTLVLLVSLAPLLSCHPPPSLKHIHGDTMGTFFTITYWAKHYTEEESLKSEIQGIFARLDAQVSNWNPDSWINKFNSSPSGIPVAAPDYAFELLKLAIDLAEKSDGLIDPTLSPLIDLWGFGTKKGNVIPDEPLIKRALAKAGYHKLAINTDEKSVLKTQKELQLNLSSIAKGFAVDLVSNYLSKNKINNYIINVGGEVAARGKKINNEYWTVGIVSPDSSHPMRGRNKKYQLINQCLATSGHNQKNFKIGEKVYSHILNPKTGSPIEIQYESITVIAHSCALADGLATLAHILDEAQMNRLLSEIPEVEVHRISKL